MTVRAAFANGNLTSSTTWEACDSTSYSNSESANTALTTSFQESSTFTPGAITIDGIAVKIASRAASPTGTMTVRLAQGGTLVTGTSVTVNVSDLPTCTATSGTSTPVATAEGGWFFFKFASSVTLVAATAYTLSAETSSSSQVNLWSTATTNWSRYLRTTTTGSPAAGDDLIITGEWTAAATVTARTVTMDSTTNTNYGSNTTTQVTPSLSICNHGTLSFGTSASTTYVFQQSGYIVVYNGGTLNIGVSGTQMPRGSSGTLQFNCAAAGNFGLVARNSSTVNMYGLSRTSGNNTVITTLAANAAGGATSLTTAVATGWLNTDSVCYASTSQTSTQFEKKALTANASGTTLTTTALTNAHSGTSPTACEVGLLTRNVVVTSVTSPDYTFFFVGNTATVNLSFAEFSVLGFTGTGTRGIEINTVSGGTFSMDSCSVHDCGSNWMTLVGSTLTGPSITNTVFYNCAVTTNSVSGLNVSQATTGTWTFSNNMFCGATSNNSNIVGLSDVGGTFTNNYVSGASGSGYGVTLLESGATIGTFTGISTHANATGGINLSVIIGGTIGTTNMWRNATAGLTQSAGQPYNQQLIMSSCNYFGNATVNHDLATGNYFCNLVLDGCALNGDTTFTTTDNLRFASSGTTGGNVICYNTAFSAVSGILTAASVDIELRSSVFAGLIIHDDCTFNAATLVGNASAIPSGAPFMVVQNFNQTANDNRSYYGNGGSTPSVIQTNTSTVYSTNTRSEQMTPNNSSNKLKSASIYVACPSGKAATPIVQVQKNSSYTGNAPRLMLRRQNSMGVTSDTVVATFSAAANTWQGLTGTTSSAPQDGVFEFYVDCDGTAGSVFVGDATATVA